MDRLQKALMELRRAGLEPKLVKTFYTCDTCMEGDIPTASALKAHYEEHLNKLHDAYFREGGLW